MKKLCAICSVIGLAIGLTACGSSSSSPTSAASAKNLTHLKFVFNFAPDGYYANLLAGQAQGFFRKEGLDVSFIVPATGADPSKLIANGSADLGIVHNTDVMLAKAQGLPVVSIGTTHQYSTLEALCRGGAHVTSLQGLYGKTYGLTGIPSDKVMFEQMLKLNHVDESKIHVVVAGFAGVPPLLAGRIDCYEAISWYEPILYNLKLGKAATDTSTYTAFPYYKYGIPRSYTFGIVTSQSWLASHADVARRFMKAWEQATQWSIAHPSAATDALVKAYPSLDAKASLPIWKASASVMTSPETKAHCLGWQSPNVWKEDEQFLLTNKLISTPVDVSKAMTNSYLPCA